MIVPTHKKISRQVKNEDVARVMSESVKMMEIIRASQTCVALAHPQIDDQDPLNFYVLFNGDVIVNPVITRHSGYTVESREGCMSFPGVPAITKNRWRKIEMTYQTIYDGTLSEIKNDSLVGFPAFIVQHETNHLDGIYCYD